MNTYTTLDQWPDLTLNQMATAITLTFMPLQLAGADWDRMAIVQGDTAFPLRQSLFKFTATQGATYDLFSSGVFDPFMLRIYDHQGNAIVANSEGDDGQPIYLPVAGGFLDQDVIRNWVAPYSGTFYVDASWTHAGIFRFHSLTIYEDTDTVSRVPNYVVVGTDTGRPSPSSHGLTGDDTIDAMTTGYQWALDPTRVIDFSISSGFGGEYWRNPTELTTQLKVALDSFSQLANVKFNYLGHFADPAQAAQAGSEINVSLDSQGLFFSSPNQWARAFFPSPSHNQTPYSGAAGDVYLNINSQASALPSYEPGSAGWFLLLHELGHALGLKHPHDDGGTGRPTLAQIGMDTLDIDLATIMSYNDEAFANLVQWDPSTPMVLDALALQYLYGPNTNTHAGNTVHALRADGMYKTLWDASGTDTLDVRTQNEGWTIYLPDLVVTTSTHSKIGFAVPNSDLQWDVPKTVNWLLGDFENVQGSAFNDFMVTNALDNQIDAGPGLDTVIWVQDQDQHRVTPTANGWVVQAIEGEGGTDRLLNVERLVFSDRGIALDLSGHAGTVAKTLGAVFGPASVNNPDLVGIGLYYLDNYGFSAESLMQLAIQARLGPWPNHAQVVNLLYTQVVGQPPSAEVRESFVQLLDSGAYTIASLGMMAANTALNQSNINLVGLAQTGLAYHLYED